MKRLWLEDAIQLNDAIEQVYTSGVIPESVTSDQKQSPDTRTV